MATVEPTEPPTVETSCPETPSSFSSSPPLSPKSATTCPQNPTQSPSPSSVLATPLSRLWRPTAQRNLRNQWSKLASYRQQWASSSSTARSHATALVNAYLSQKYYSPVSTYTCLFITETMCCSGAWLEFNFMLKNP
ncbi:hypothetical protein GBA52_015502 [Prunus armeniaca]|nr:hypothetical protein GBA52_015502 [Prunus armeniaca]